MAIYIYDAKAMFPSKCQNCFFHIGCLMLVFRVDLETAAGESTATTGKAATGESTAGTTHSGSAGTSATHTGSAHTGSLRVSALDHEITDYPVEDGTVVEALFGEFHEVAGGDGHVLVHLDGDVSHVGVKDDVGHEESMITIV